MFATSHPIGARTNLGGIQGNRLIGCLEGRLEEHLVIAPYRRSGELKDSSRNDHVCEEGKHPWVLVVKFDLEVAAQSPIDNSRSPGYFT